MPIEIDITQNAMFKWGETQGEARGQARGEARGEAKALTRLLQDRFGTLPDSFRTRIENADVELLDRWLSRVYRAATLEAVFAD